MRESFWKWRIQMFHRIRSTPNRYVGITLARPNSVRDNLPYIITIMTRVHKFSTWFFIPFVSFTWKMIYFIRKKKMKGNMWSREHEKNSVIECSHLSIGITVRFFFSDVEKRSYELNEKKKLKWRRRLWGKIIKFAKRHWIHFLVIWF